MKRVFVDTSAFFAHIVITDANHLRAVALFEQADTEDWQLVTTNAVISETYALLLNRTKEKRPKAIEFLDKLAGIEVVRLTEEDEAKQPGLRPGLL